MKLRKNPLSRAPRELSALHASPGAGARLVPNALGLLGTLLVGCHPGPEPCLGATCGAEGECLAQRCVPRGGDPVPADSIRAVLEPITVAAVARDALDSTTPAIVAFGSTVERQTVLYLRFRRDGLGPAPIANAFLLLRSAPATPKDPRDVPIDVLRVEDHWTPETLTWSHRPRLIPLPRGRGLGRSSPPTTLRVDVTELVRRAQGDGAELSLAVRAHEATGNGVSYSTGAGGGPLPRLEVYQHAL